MGGVITPKVNGPYFVSGIETLTDSKGADLLSEAASDKPRIALCRCGKSDNKPFCDGAHARAGFNSATENPKTGKWKDYVGKQITIHDNRRLCAHAGECTHGLPGVWRMKERPWIDPDGADVDAIIKVIDKCPSGALSYSLAESDPNQAEMSDSVVVCKDGPYHVTGAVTLNDPSRNTDDIPSRYALCRCGASKNKPFCDGSHWEVKFKDG
jgi:CDGSH-type Zn-finger protein